jgi:hypothetical protein
MIGALPAGVAHADEPRSAERPRASPTPRPESPSTIAVVCDPGDRFGLRAVAELESLGFAAVIVAPGDAPAMPSEHVGALLFAAIPLNRPEVQGAHGSADLAAGLGGLGARFLLTTRASRWAPTVDAGLAVVGLASKGRGDAGFTSGSSFAATAAPFLRFGVAFAPTPRLRVRADVLASAVVQGTSIQIAAREAATWGRPVGLFSAGVDFGLF